MLVDTHVHVWDLLRHSHSWTKQVSLLHRSFGMSDYDEATRELAVSKVVLVEADVDEEDILFETRYLLSLADQNNLVAGVVAAGRPERTDFQNYLDQIAGHPKLKGIRRVLHNLPYDHDAIATIGTLTFVENLRLLTEYNLSFDLCLLNHQLPAAVRLLEQCPKVDFVLDHCGCPGPKQKVFDAWSKWVKLISDFPNVSCKVSGLVGYTGHDDWSVDAVRSHLDFVVECFGWERVMFGSDWPVCTLSSSAKEWAQVVSCLTQRTTEHNRRQLFSETAERVYRL